MLCGRFVGGIGTFVGDSEVEGRPVQAKYVWRNVTATSATWEHWFSFDDEAT